MTPIEKAARALSQDYWKGKCNAEQLAAYVDRTWPRYVGRVRLVLEAVREAIEELMAGPEQAVEMDGSKDAQIAVDAYQRVLDLFDPTTNEIDRLKALKGEAI